jgi:TM2 domain-containing membrane protein YozV
VTQEWYYTVNDERQGPISAADLKKLAEAGTLKATDLVWKDGMTDWAQAKSIKGLFAGGSGANPAPAAARAEEPARAKPRAEDEEDDRPSARGRRRDEDEDDDRPSRRRDVDDEEDRPSRRRDVDDEEDDRPSGRVRRRDTDVDDEDDRPARRRDDDEDRPRKRKRSRVPEDTANKKLVAGLLGILIGWLGIHKFYLGFTTAGVIMILLACTGISSIIGLIEGIIYLTKSDEDFHRDYVIDQKQWF